MRTTIADAGRKQHKPLTGIMLAALLLLLTACAPAAPAATTPAITAAPDQPLPVSVPPLPFADNPDPTQCGIPEPVALSGIAHGEVDGALAGPVIFLYDSHLRQKVTGQIFPGTQLDILLRQSNPTLNYYFVKTKHVEPAQEGWIPAPFVTVSSS